MPNCSFSKIFNSCIVSPFFIFYINLLKPFSTLVNFSQL
nr:MAG TPA: hypothetical protein [Caudoviricetes sp.]